MESSNILLNDSITRERRNFEQIDPIQPIKWYSCGPTIYDSAHLGHARTYITFDIIRRIFEYKGYSVFYVMNITDIDDKIIKRVQEKSGSNKFDEKIYYKFVKDMEQDFWNDMDKLNVKRPNIISRVTDNIEKIIKYVAKIIENGFAYVSNGSVYFNSTKFIDNGHNFEPLKTMINSDYTECKFISEKKNKKDFALWKSVKPGEISFQSPWGHGRPAWHIECSVIASDILGESFDIHSGGIDLLFPHHNNEIIQAHAYQNKSNNEFNWVRYFLHSGHLNIDGFKMAKSLKNFISIKDYLENIGTAQQLRILFLLHDWDKMLDYSKNSVDEAKYYDKKLYDFFKHVEFELNKKKIKSIMNDNDLQYKENIIKFKNISENALNNNFNTKIIMKELHTMINKTYSYFETDYNSSIILEFNEYSKKIVAVFGLQFQENTSDLETDKFIQVAVDLRKNIRNIVNKNVKNIDKNTLKELFTILDDFRDVKLKQLGIQLEDRSTNKETKWIKFT